MKLYTKTGDQGNTGLLGGGRVPKDDIQVEAYGTVDEANSLIGAAGSFLTDDQSTIREELEKIQHELFNCGGDLSIAKGREKEHPFRVKKERVAFLEKRIDYYMGETSPIERFILPGGTPIAAHLHAARTVVRRAERRVVTLSQRQPVNPYVKQYLNRLSDYLFSIARYMNKQAGIKDVEYTTDH